MSNGPPSASADAPNPSDADFRVVLDALVDAYEPVLQADLRLAGDLDARAKEADAQAPDCDAELAAADALFRNIFDEKFTFALLPAQARELLGPNDNWRWCLLHIRCCIVFGWLSCRRQRSFRSSACCLYRYRLFVRQVLGTPVTPGTLKSEGARRAGRC